MRTPTIAWLAAPAAALAAVAALTGSPASASGPQPHHLDLGPSDLPESRTTTTVQPGVTLTRITRGSTDPSQSWTVETGALADRPAAEAHADRLRSEGFDPRVEEVREPAAADVPAGTLGYRVRVGHYPTQADADQERARLAAAGEKASTVYTGWDGDPAARGPWHVNVVRIDPGSFSGRLRSSFGPDLYNRETTSALASAAGASIGVNGGFFVLDPASGAPGDPAGAGVYGGRLLSEPTNDRPALVLHDDARRTAVRRLTWAGRVHVGGRDLALDGVDRVPGLIRNCGGDSTDQPTSRPLHDTTCTDDSELVAFTPDYGRDTPAGPGREVVLDGHDIVRSVTDTRGTTLPPRWTSVQGTGSLADALAGVHVGDRVPVSTRLLTADGSPAGVTPSTTVVNGGPLLVQDGREDVTLRRDGFVHDGDPGFAYGWVVRRNPRTFAGVDRSGRTVLVTVDGRSASDLGLSVAEEADVARSLGLVDAVNLDGGGSTTLAVDGRLASHPSDSTGERPVGDAVLVQPRPSS